MADDAHSVSDADADGGTMDRLRAREAMLSEAERLVRLGSFVWEVGDRALWSDEFYRILGYAPGEVEPSGRAFYAAVHPDDRALVLAAQHSARDGGPLPDCEYRVIRRDTGALRYCRSSGCVYRAPNGSVQRIVGALLDITESKRSALALEQALAVSSAAEELAQAGSFVVRLRPIEITLSEGLRRLAGLPEGTLGPDQGMSVVHPDDRAAMLAWWQRLLRSRELQTVQTRCLRPDGSLRHLYTRASIRVLSDGGERAVGTTIDITERVQLEEDVQRAAKLEAVGTLAAGIAHDFNNYLMVVSGALQHLPRADEATRERLVANALHAVRRSAELTRQLLGFARCQSFAPELIDVCAVVERLQELFRQSVGRRAELRLQTGTGPLLARLDPRQLEQMLANLIVNSADAIEAARGGLGEVRIVVERLQLTAASTGVPDDVPPGHYTRISVEDDGGGIAPEYLPRIFEPYFTTKPRGRGTGLGLSAVYGMTHQNAGVVTVEALRAGTRFGLWFPVPDPPPSAAGAAEPALSTGRRVLVVDDAAALRETIAAWLRAAGYQTFEAENAEAALAELATRAVDLVLSDLQMPGLDGYELAAEIRRRHAGLPVVLMTGYAGANHEPGTPPVLCKPFGERELLAAVQAMIR